MGSMSKEEMRKKNHHQQQQPYYIRFSQFFFLSPVQPLIFSKGILSIFVLWYVCVSALLCQSTLCRLPQLLHTIRHLCEYQSFCVHTLAIGINGISRVVVVFHYIDDHMVKCNGIGFLKIRNLKFFSLLCHEPIFHPKIVHMCAW